MMFDPLITPYRLLSWVGWIAATTLIVLDVAWLATDGFGHLGLLIAGGAAVLNVRGFTNTLECRERRAFELGRDSVREMRR